MTRVYTILAICCVFALVASAASIDGKWSSESSFRGRKGGDGGGKAMTFTSVFDFKSDGNTLTGTITRNRPGGQGSQSVEIKNGKIDGNKFSFSVTQKRGDNEVTIQYSGTVEGDTLKGQMMPEGAPQARDFTAKRQ